MTPEEYSKLTEGQKVIQSRITQAHSVSQKISALKRIIQVLSNPLDLNEHSALQMTVYNRAGGVMMGHSMHRDDVHHIQRILELDILPRLEAEYEQI